MKAHLMYTDGPPASKMRVKRFAIREEILFSILQGSERGWREVDTGGHTKRKLSLRKVRVFVIEKSIRDVKQGQKVGPDLLESITKATDPVKDELRNQRFSGFHLLDVGKMDGFPSEANTACEPSKL